MEESLVLMSTNYPILVDGFTSHLAQLLSDRATLVYASNFRERSLHPGACPRILQLHPNCAPCAYRQRAGSSGCLAGFSYCVAFNRISEWIGIELEQTHL